MPKQHHSIIPKNFALNQAASHDSNKQLLSDSASIPFGEVYQALSTRIEGLSDEEAQVRRDQFGPNALARDSRPGIVKLLWRAFLNPLVILLVVLSSIEFSTGDFRAGMVMVVMITLGVLIKLIQEAKADNAAAKLKAMISVKATVLRNSQSREFAVVELVPGDVVSLAAGDMIPADLRIVSAKDFFVSQSSLTGESFPAEKFAIESNPGASTCIELTSIAFLGTSVETGTAMGIVIATGEQTYLGGMAKLLTEEPSQTAFDKGISQFTWLMLRFMLGLPPSPQGTRFALA